MSIKRLFRVYRKLPNGKLISRFAPNGDEANAIELGQTEYATRPKKNGRSNNLIFDAGSFYPAGYGHYGLSAFSPVSADYSRAVLRDNEIRGHSYPISKAAINALRKQMAAASPKAFNKHIKAYLNDVFDESAIPAALKNYFEHEDDETVEEKLDTLADIKSPKRTKDFRKATPRFFTLSPEFFNFDNPVLWRDLAAHFTKYALDSNESHNGLYVVSAPEDKLLKNKRIIKGHFDPETDFLDEILAEQVTPEIEIGDVLDKYTAFEDAVSRGATYDKAFYDVYLNSLGLTPTDLSDENLKDVYADMCDYHTAQCNLQRRHANVIKGIKEIGQ